MPTRKDPLITGCYYHIYNRAQHNLVPFSEQSCLIEFTKGIRYYTQYKPKTKLSMRDKVKRDIADDYKNRLVDILAYCIMPNHYHLLLKQRQDNGISTYIRRLQNSFVHYYNTKHHQKGSLFQGNFQSSLITSQEHLIHVSRYIHLNPTSAKIVKDPFEYPYSSFSMFVNQQFSPPFIPDDLLGSHETPTSYVQFVRDNILYQQELQIIKHELLDVDL